MPRRPRIVVPHQIYHVTQRGSRRQRVFFSDRDYGLYRELLSETCERFEVDLLQYCCMPNHVHLLLRPTNETGLSRAMQTTHGRYARIINERYEWVGHLWQERFRSAAVISRMIRSMMLEVLNEDYVRTAWSKGLQPRVVIVKHALRNALLPVVTMLGMLIASLIDGAVVRETVFNLPGVGLHLIESVRGRDATMVLGMVLLIGVFMMVWILLIDLSYKVLDPRITYE